MNTRPNTNLATGIAYGVISSQNLDPELVDQLMYGPQAKDLSYENWIDDRRNDLHSQIHGVLEDCGMENPDYLSQVIVDGISDEDFGDYHNDEPLITGRYEGVRYGTCWLGGALNFFIFESSVVLDDVPECSPCLPCAGDLDSYLAGRRGNAQCYGVDVTWLNPIHFDTVES